MMPHRCIEPRDVIALRREGRSSKEIGIHLAKRHRRPVPYLTASIQAILVEWLKDHPEDDDLREIDARRRSRS